VNGSMTLCVMKNFLSLSAVKCAAAWKIKEYVYLDALSLVATGAAGRVRFAYRSAARAAAQRKAWLSHLAGRNIVADGRLGARAARVRHITPSSNQHDRRGVSVVAMRQNYSLTIFSVHLGMYAAIIRRNVNELMSVVDMLRFTQRAVHTPLTGCGRLGWRSHLDCRISILHLCRLSCLRTGNGNTGVRT